MPEPMTILAALGTPVLTEGIKFLYGQASEILKRWRERQDKSVQPADPLPVTEVSLPQDVFEGCLTNPTIHFDKVGQLENELRQLRRDLSDYAEGIDEVDNADSALLEKVDKLRTVLESIFQQHITFKGENRSPSGTPVVFGRVHVKEVKEEGEATGVKAGTITNGSKVKGEVVTDRIEKGGRATGVEVDNIGSKPS